MAPKELSRLREQFVTTFAVGEFQGLLRDLGKTASLSSDYEEIVRLDLDKAKRQGWLSKLIDLACEQNENFRALLQTVADESVSVFDACYFERRPLVDRVNLRGSLRALHADDDEAARILIVDGDRYSGKSYTADFIHHLARKLGFSVRRIELLKQAPPGRELSPELLGRAIVEEMKLDEDMPEVEHDQVAWWTTHYLSWLVRNLRDRGEAWWIVIDDFTQVNVSGAVHEFIEEMALKINDSLDSLRLVLVGYDRALPEKLEPIIERDRTEPITDAHLVDYFVQFVRDYAPHVEADAAPRVVADAVRTVRELMSQRDARNRLVGMSAAVARECRRLRKGN